MYRISFFILLLSFSVAFRVSFSQIELVVNPYPTSCPESNDGRMEISVSASAYPVILKVFRAWNGVLVQSIILNSDDAYTVKNLHSGDYWVKHLKNDLFSDSLNVTIEKPESLSKSKIVVIELPSGESMCDGSIKAVAVGGTSPYSYKWLTVNHEQQEISGVCWGIYQCQINDANNCGPVKADLPLYSHMIEKLEYEKNTK